MTPDVTAEAGLYSGAGDPLNGAQVRPVEMSESDRSLVIRRISDDTRLADRPGHFSGLARRFLLWIVKFIAFYNKERPMRNLFRRLRGAPPQVGIGRVSQLIP
jgi:hypothetical protein